MYNKNITLVNHIYFLQTLLSWVSRDGRLFLVARPTYTPERSAVEIVSNRSEELVNNNNNKNKRRQSKSNAF